MFIRKHVVAFFILQNIVSSFCGTIQVDVDPESEGSEYMDSNELSDYSGENDGILIEFTLSAFFLYLQSIFISGPELLNSMNNFDDYLDTNFHKKMALIGWESNSKVDSEYSYEEYLENYITSNWDSYSNENSENYLIPDSENNFKRFCPGEELSVISHSDIKYLIEEKAEILKIKENLVNSYYPDAAELLKNNIDNLEEFKKRFKERPDHMLHVLQGITSWRQGLEPNVEEIAAQLEQFYMLEDNFKDVANGSAVMLNELEKYKKICKINCEEDSVEKRFGHDISNSSVIVSNRTGMYCIRIKDLNDYINKKLIEKQAQSSEGLIHPREIREKLYEQNISELKNNLKEAAVKQFGMTMYDILSLHDDYHHFINDLEHVNISSEIDNIAENIAQIGFIRIGLKRDLEKYRQYCMKCGNQRVKRNVFEFHEGVEELSVIPIKNTDTGASLSVHAAVDELIEAKINEIKEGIQSNFTTMFAVLDEMFNDPNVLDTYLRELHSIQDVIEKDIKMEQEAFYRLRSRIPVESIDKIIFLSKESKEMKQNLESAKRLIGPFIQRF